MDDVSNYVASGWKRDLTHIISCHWKDQVGPLDSEEWEVGIQRFVRAMKEWKNCEWMDIKELTPLKFMPYIAKLFWDITDRDLKGISDYMGWVGLGGYYHWKLSELGQLSACPCLQGKPVPDGPIGRPSGQPLCRPAQTGASASRASGRHQGGNQPTSNWGRKTPTSSRGRRQASVARGGKWAASGGLVDLPLEREGAGDGQSWFKQSVQETEWEACESWSPPYPIGPARARWEAIGQIYEHMAGKKPPPSNVASEAIQAYYLGIEARTVKTGTMYDIRVPHGLCDPRITGHQPYLPWCNWGKAPSPSQLYPSWVIGRALPMFESGIIRLRPCM